MDCLINKLEDLYDNRLKLNFDKSRLMDLSKTIKDQLKFYNYSPSTPYSSCGKEIKVLLEIQYHLSNIMNVKKNDNKLEMIKDFENIRNLTKKLKTKLEIYL